MKNNIEKDLFLDKSIREGGFYELAIQVCPSMDNNPIQLYTDFIWTLPNVKGAFDKDYNLIKVDIENNRHDGILLLDNFAIPFMTYNIREDSPIETGFNWFDICFYTAAIEKVFGAEYQTWTENPKVPKELKKFFNKTLKGLFNIYPFLLAMIEFDISGEYYLEDLHKPLTNTWNPSHFFIGQNNYELIAPENRKRVTIVENIKEE